MATCKTCEGIGSTYVPCGCHPHDPGCHHPDVAEECPDCEGCGRYCDSCAEPLPLCLGPSAVLCRECRNAEAEDIETEVAESLRLRCSLSRASEAPHV